MRNARQDKPTKVFSKEKGQFVDNSAWIYTLFIYYFNYIINYIILIILIYILHIHLHVVVNWKAWFTT